MELKTKPRCVFKYLTKCQINPCPPGFADCLRGMIASYNYSKNYNYDFLICKNTHPIFQFFKNTPYFIEDSIDDSIELIAPLSYKQIDIVLESMFKGGDSFSILTNSFYKNDRGELEWFPRLGKDVQKFFCYAFIPNDDISNRIKEIFINSYYFTSDTPFNVIHLRTMELEDDSVQGKIEEMVEYFYEKINPLVKGASEKFVLMTDSEKVANMLCSLMPELCYWSNKKGHTGVIVDDIDSIRDTVIDFFIMTKAKKIYTITDKYAHMSGFCKIVSLLYDIEYIVL